MKRQKLKRLSFVGNVSYVAECFLYLDPDLRDKCDKKDKSVATRLFNDSRKITIAYCLSAPF